jgi:hypothetical protein
LEFFSSPQFKRAYEPEALSHCHNRRRDSDLRHVKVRLIIFGLVYLCTVATGRAADPVNVMGISIGMPMTELKQLLQAKNWPCEQAGNNGFRCTVQEAGAEKQDITIQTGAFLPNTPVIRMTVIFSTSENPVPSLVHKFGQPNWANGANANWRFNRVWLEIQTGGVDHILLFSDPDLVNANFRA